MRIRVAIKSLGPKTGAHATSIYGKTFVINSNARIWRQSQSRKGLVAHRTPKILASTIVHAFALRSGDFLGWVICGVVVRAPAKGFGMCLASRSSRSKRTFYLNWLAIPVVTARCTQSQRAARTPVAAAKNIPAGKLFKTHISNAFRQFPSIPRAPWLCQSNAKSG